MKSILMPLFTGVLALSAARVQAHGDVRCDPAVPKAEWRSHNDLYKKLTDEGWIIRQMKETPTCYEVYAKDPKRKRVEVFFHPKSFALVE